MLTFIHLVRQIKTGFTKFAMLQHSPDHGPMYQVKLYVDNGRFHGISWRFNTPLSHTPLP